MTSRNFKATWASNRVIIDFTRAGWRSFEKVNRALGAHYIRPFALRNELAAYIAAHEAQGRHFDTEGEEIRYDGGVYVVIRKMQGVWYIIDAYMTEIPVDFEPIYFWQRIRRGINYVLAKLVIGWRVIKTSAVSRLDLSELAVAE